jgi:hypothetical protein
MQIWLLKQRFVTYICAMRDMIRGGATSKGVILDRSVSRRRAPRVTSRRARGGG